jgi:Flp pilus assembly protein TadG
VLTPGRHFWRGTRSTAGMEFALIAPVMVALFFAVYDISDAMITYQEVFNAARVISASVSSISVQASNSSTKLYYAQVQLEASSIFAQMPELRSGFHNGIRSITVSSINFETKNSCTPGTNCTYLPYVVWSVAYGGPPVATGLTFTNALRSCATQTVSGSTATLNQSSALSQTTATGSAAGNLTVLRTSTLTNETTLAAAPDPIIVVDVHYQYVPVFNVFVKTPVDLWADGYWPLRSVQATELTGGKFVALNPDQQYTGLVSTATTSSGVVTQYTIAAGNMYPPSSSLTATVPTAGTNYCISPYYAEPSS